MIIDCHYHLEKRVYTVDRLISEMQKSSVDKVALMGTMIESVLSPLGPGSYLLL
jgi:Tat protein secretion system quality control protein TatD with DNase activity